MDHFFGIYGEVCATHPWEVIVAAVTLTTIFLTTEYKYQPQLSANVTKNGTEFWEASSTGIATDVIVMTIIRCLAILYTYNQIRSLQRFESKYIIGISAFFATFSSLVFISAVFNVLNVNIPDLKDALFFFLLLMDVNKAAKLAQYALTAANTEEISIKIATGMAILGPTITLNTLVKTLIIGISILASSGFRRFEVLSYYACLAAVVNYVTFMTFYPSCLSLMLELSRMSGFHQGGPRTHQIPRLLIEESDKPNPAAQRVKLIMSIVLFIVHVYSRYTFTDQSDIVTDSEALKENSPFYHYLLKRVVFSVDHVVIFIILLILMAKLVFFDNRSEALQRVLEPSVAKKSTKDNQTSTKEILALCGSSSDKIECHRTLEQCLQIYRSYGAEKLSDSEIILLVDTKHIPPYDLEKVVQNPERGVKIRRKILESSTKVLDVLVDLPYKNYDYSKVMGACCENVVGYVPIPLGIAGPLLLDDKFYYIPMATTEGCLVASANRGCKALEKCGIKSSIVSDGMTRGPVIRFPSITKASEAIIWLEKPENFQRLKLKFDSTSRFARLIKVSTRIAGRYVFIRFVAKTGDAMGMNMLSKGTEKALSYMHGFFPEMELLSLSGNYCSDKKASAVNWIEGRGKSVVCEAILSEEIVLTVLKCRTQALVDLNISKNMIGSAVAGSLGGFNAHAANMVTAIFIATGQDPAQNVASSNCITIMEPWGDTGRDLHISCSMPSIEIGTIGGGTVLPAQAACLELLGVKGPHLEEPGNNANQLARIVCGAVLAGELSLMAALATGSLVKSHLKYNRSYTEKDSIC